MAKNNSLINMYKDFYRKVEDTTPAIYASIVLALHEVYGWGHDEIEPVLMASQRIWEEHYSDLKGMCDRCEEEVDIIIQRG